MCPGFFSMVRDDSPDIHGTNSFSWYPSHERCTVCNADYQVLHLTILVAQPGIEPRPVHYQSYVFNHSATALLNIILVFSQTTLANLNGITVGTPVLLRGTAVGRRDTVGETVCTLHAEDNVPVGKIRTSPCVMYSLGLRWGTQVQ